MKRFNIANRGFAIPGTNILTDIASKQMVPNTLSHRFRNFAFEFDIEVRDAAAAVENVGLEDGLGWAGIDTARAGTASIGSREAIIEFKTGQNAAQEETRADLLIDHACVLAEPADTGIFGKN